MEQKIKDIKEKIVRHIKVQKLAMKPRWHFLLFALLRGLVVFIVFSSLVYLASFISLIMREHQLFELFGLRPKGVWQFMVSMPWLLILFSLLLLIVLEVLTRKFAFVYKRPVAYSLFALIILVLGSGFFVHKIDRELRFARFGECPDTVILGKVHRYYRGELENRPFVRGMHKLSKSDLNNLRKEGFERPSMMPVMPPPCR